MTTEQLKVGDTVKLKSGGPLMTVTAVGHDDTSRGPVIWCSWFDDKGKESTGYFPAAAVKADDGMPVIA
jgi:uncharacterized protein YodC (DUF2158 family)